MSQYNKEQLRDIFRKSFDKEAWKAILRNLFHADMLRTQSEEFETPDNNTRGFYMGSVNTSDSYKIGLFYYIISAGSVAHKKVGLRNLVKSWVNPTWGEFDAAIVVFDDKTEWRLSFVCDIKDAATTPRRYTFVFGEKDNLYRTPIERFLQLQSQDATFDNIRKAFSVDALSDDFFNQYRDLYADFVQYITGKRYVKESGKWVERSLGQPNSQYESTFGCDDKLVRDYIKKMFGRIVFLYFLQRKGWLDGNRQYMHDLFVNSDIKDNFLDGVLEPLFFEILNEKPEYRTAEANSLPGSENIPYLNGGLFAKDDVDDRICVFPESYFSKLFGFLDSYNFTIDENDADDAEIGIDPEMLGRIFENLLEDNKDKGAFYTPKEIVDYMCRESIIAYLQNDAKTEAGKEQLRNFVETLDGESFSIEQRKFIKDRLKNVKICDPAIGSGAFPMGLVNLLSKLYQALHLSTDFALIKRHIMEQNIYGVDIEKGAVDIARLRFWLAMIVEEKDPMPLPNLHFKIMQGNSLLESYQGIDLSDLTKVNGVHASLFDSDDSERQTLIADLKRFYTASDHTERDRLFTDIIRNVRRQLFSKQITLPSGTDPSENPDFFLWHTWFTDVFEHGGFDIVIGNPPYIQLQKSIGVTAKDKKGRDYDMKLGDLYVDEGFQTFAKTGDIYCLFYEQGAKMLKPGGHLCYITSNKWMRAGYGEKLRGFFATQTNPEILIDFGGVQVFESATVDTNILLFAKASNQGKTLAATIQKGSRNGSFYLSDFMRHNATETCFSGADSWVILSPIEQSIKRKIEAVGVPLKDWDIQINYGIKTGFNDAFIISTGVRNQILENCADKAERERTDALIRPILRGRDIKRYGYEWADLWLIYIPWHFPYQFDESIQGASEKAEIAFKEQYPAVYSHMLQYKEPLSKRNKAETGIRYEWYALQRWGAKYWDDFYSAKIIFQEIVQESQFCFDEKGEFMCNDTCRIISGTHLPFLLHILNSKLFFYCVKNFYGGGGLGDGVRMKHTFFLKFPCIRPIQDMVISESDDWIYVRYNLTPEEISVIEQL